MQQNEPDVAKEAASKLVAAAAVAGAHAYKKTLEDEEAANADMIPLESNITFQKVPGEELKEQPFLASPLVVPTKKHNN